MTLLETIRTIERVASLQPAINMIVRNDVFRLSTVPDARYGVFAWLQNQHISNVASSLITYSFTFFYVDRLTENLSNQVEIQSVGIQTLDNIIRTLEELGVFAENDYTFQVFNQRFADECAGVFCNVTLSVPKDIICADTFDDIDDNVMIY